MAESPQPKTQNKARKSAEKIPKCGKLRLGPWAVVTFFAKISIDFIN